MKDFILQPWEYQGASFDPKAHAETRLEVGGKKRNFLLKLREGVLYFKEPSRAQIFAIPQVWEQSLATDSIGLISAFQRGVGEGNYGALFTKRDYFAKLPVRGHFLLLVRADGTGWMREHFDPAWFSLPEWEKPLAFDLWDDKAFESQVSAVLPIVKDSLLQRTIEPEIRQADTARWIGGTEAEFSALIIAATHLFVPPGNASSNTNPLLFKMKSHSAFAKGEIEGYWFKNACRRPAYGAIWQLMEKQFRFVGVRWSEGGEEVEMYPRARVEKVYKAGLEQWGENWRGNWAPQRGSLELAIPHSNVMTAHEKLESALVLRQWLKDKMPAEQIEALFQSINLG